MDFAQIKAKLEELEIDPEQLEKIEDEDTDDEELDKKGLEMILGKFKIVDSYGGEGEGEQYYKVYHFLAHDIFIKTDAIWISYDGIDWDGSEFYEVHHFQVTKTEYK